MSLRKFEVADGVDTLGSKWDETSLEWYTECFHQLALVGHHIGVTYKAFSKSMPQDAKSQAKSALGLLYTNESMAQYETLQRDHLKAFHPITLTNLFYNLSCIHAVQGNQTEASEAMYRHLKAGLDNLTQKPGDEDFINDIIGTQEMLQKDANLRNLRIFWGEAKLNAVRTWIN